MPSAASLGVAQLLSATAGEPMLGPDAAVPSDRVGVMIHL